jgi:hypothetical protein
VRALHGHGGPLPALAGALDFVLEARVPDELAITIALYAIRAALPWRRPQAGVRDGGEGSHAAIDDALVQKLLRLIGREEASLGMAGGEGGVCGGWGWGGITASRHCGRVACPCCAEGRLVALDCLAVALPQARDATLRDAFLEDTLRQVLADAALPERYIPNHTVAAPSRLCLCGPGRGEEVLMIGGRAACSASLVERGVVVGMSLLGGGCATLHGTARGLRCVIDMACDALHTRPTTIQVCIACAGQAASAPAVATSGNGQWAMGNGPCRL